MTSPPPSIRIRPSILYFGTPVLLITSRNPDGGTNITPMSSAWALADRVVLGLTGGGQGLANLEREREAVLNVAAPALWSAIEAIARATGRDPVPAWKSEVGYRHVPDKFAAAGLTPCASTQVKPPRIAECPLQLEARVVEVRRRDLAAWRADAGHFAVVETEVVAVHAHADVVVPGSDHVDPTRFDPLLYVFRHYVAGGERLGRTFKAEV
ncbi:flavin reductase [Dokdonella sp.]|uniref:flavin reductase family protein n=1 Tax=Dokdonella sp. TaxID=2291710 RepID=UPI001B1C14A0|nr:flavin reductase [Dokdonella sp.]MBO9661764.1 flavin reductase [Dokdonella sp.]